MNRFFGLPTSRRILTITLAATLLVGIRHAVADPPDILREYRFIPSLSSVHVVGGVAGLDWNLAIDGKFGLVTGYDYFTPSSASIPQLIPSAEFIDVHAILYNPLSLAPLPLPGWDLDKTLDLTGLKGTYSPDDPNSLFFFGADGQGVAMKLDASIHGDLIHLVGANEPNLVGADYFKYQIDAVGILTPYPDFNADAGVDGADFMAWQTHYAMAAGATFADGDADGDGDVDGADFVAWQTAFGASSSGGAAIVPEPATLGLAIAALSMFGFFRRGARQFVRV